MAPRWERRGKLMRFESGSLDSTYGGCSVLALAYRFKDDDSDPWTRRINSFKDGRSKAIRGACRTTVAALKTLRFNDPPIVVTACIPSAKTELTPDDPVFILGKYIAKELDLEWRPDLLKKKVHRSLHKMKEPGDARDDEVHNTYTAIKISGFNSVLIVDDICTRGATIGEAFRAIRKANPGIKGRGIVLGKSESRSYWENRDDPIDNDHVSSDLAELWDKE